MHAAYEAFKKARRQAKDKAIPIDSILSQSFYLFSSDYIHRYDLASMGVLEVSTKRVDFDCLDEDEIADQDKNPSNKGNKLGKGSESWVLCILTEAPTVVLATFASPHAPGRRKDVELKCHGGEYDLRIKFFGGGYQKLCISRNFVLETGYVSAVGAPEMFKFAGI